MSWVDRVNRAIQRRVAPASTLTVSAGGIESGDGTRYRYADLERVVAFRHASLVGEALALALDFGRENVVVVNQADDAWPQVVSALDADARSRMLSSEWSLALLAAKGETELEIFSALG